MNYNEAMKIIKERLDGSYINEVTESSFAQFETLTIVYLPKSKQQKEMSG